MLFFLNFFSRFPASTWFQAVPFEMDLCDLLQSMKLQYEKTAADAPFNVMAYPPLAVDVQDVAMPEDPSYHSDGDCSSQSSRTSSDEQLPGCAYLQSIRAQLDNYITTGGGYLEAIFTHREVSAAYPSAHLRCSQAFSDLAYLLEKRAWRADRDADTEAVAAFRHEAWMIAAST
ncbi:hypothetical protein AMATHDRAFT_140650 [Amanita thiersii Skay4041]|uniref:Uncharacterized protein n=1 Tax=Amanita thiersii Skay4041 TaxID=703135 RepID=A0A2A9NWR0_9AGAR|nr:hypothetical protein AMATHDRAFT_140650 [Amanita thiersii Skay4041]